MLITLSDQRERTLDHAKRYGMATPSSVNALLYHGQKPDTAKRLLLRMKAAGLLASFHIGSQVYYQLSTRGASTIGASRYATTSIGAMALVERLSVLAYCALQDHKRTKLFAQEVQALVPGLAVCATQSYAFDFSTGRLHRLTVDAGGSISYLHRKAVQMARLAAEGPLGALMSDQKFVVTLLTPYTEKARRLRAHLVDAPVSCPIEVVVLKEVQALV